MEIILEMAKILLGIFAIFFARKCFNKLIDILLKIEKEFCQIYNLIESMKPTDIDKLPFTEIVKEVRRRQVLLGKLADNLANVVAAGVSRAFKKR